MELWSGHVFSSYAECSTRCRFSHEMLLYLQTDEIKHDLILAEHYQGFIDALFFKERPEVKALNQKKTSSSSPKTPSGKPSQNSHSETEDLLEMSVTETGHGNKDLETFANN